MLAAVAGGVLNLRNLANERPVGAGALAERAPEIPAQMALVAVSRPGGNGGEGERPVVEEAAGALHPEASGVFPDRAAEPGPEGPGHVNRVPSDLTGQIGQRAGAGLVVQQVAGAVEPAMAGVLLDRRFLPQLGEQLEHQRFDGQGGDVVPPGQLGAEPSPDASDHGRAARRCVGSWQGVVGDFDHQAFHRSRSHLVGVHHAGGLRDDRRGAEDPSRSLPDRLGVLPVEHDVQGRLTVGVGWEPQPGREPSESYGEGSGADRGVGDTAEHAGGEFDDGVRVCPHAGLNRRRWKELLAARKSATLLPNLAKMVAEFEMIQWPSGPRAEGTWAPVPIWR